MAQRNCAQCGRPFGASRPQAKFCGATCRSRAHRAGKSGRSPVVSAAQPQWRPDPAHSDLISAVVADLEKAGRQGSALGHQAVLLAREMAQVQTGAGLAALSKELRSVMDAALHNAAPAADPLDELIARRNAKRAATQWKE